jgi:hypothetical protein
MSVFLRNIKLYVGFEVLTAVVMTLETEMMCLLTLDSTISQKMVLFIKPHVVHERFLGSPWRFLLNVVSCLPNLVFLFKCRCITVSNSPIVMFIFSSRISHVHMQKIIMEINFK